MILSQPARAIEKSLTAVALRLLTVDWLPSSMKVAIAHQVKRTSVMRVRQLDELSSERLLRVANDPAERVLLSEDEIDARDLLNLAAEHTDLAGAALRRLSETQTRRVTQSTRHRSEPREQRRSSERRPRRSCPTSRRPGPHSRTRHPHPLHRVTQPAN